MGGWVSGRMGGWVDGWVGQWMDGWVDGWMGGWVGGWMSGWMGGWTDGWVGRWAYVCARVRVDVCMVVCVGRWNLACGRYNNEGSLIIDHREIPVGTVAAECQVRVDHVTLPCVQTNVSPCVRAVHACVCMHACVRAWCMHACVCAHERVV